MSEIYEKCSDCGLVVMLDEARGVAGHQEPVCEAFAQKMVALKGQVAGLAAASSQPCVHCGGAIISIVDGFSMHSEPKCPAVLGSGPNVILSQDEFVEARPGNRREDYDPAIAQLAAMKVTEMDQRIAAIARERGVGHIVELGLDVASAIIIEIMMKRYEEVPRA